MSIIDHQSPLAIEADDDAVDTATGNSEEEANDRLVQAAIDGAARGEMDAIRFLYVYYAAEVRIAVKGVIKDSHEAEDVAQEVFIKLIAVIEQYRQRDGVPFAAWIRRVARNCAYDFLRSRRATPSDEVEPHSEHGQFEHERRRDICQALDSLPSEQRSVMVLRHIRGLSPLEIADVLGKSESSVHGLHHRGRLNLRKSLAKLGASPVVAPRAR